jgi:hypothetical protein
MGSASSAAKPAAPSKVRCSRLTPTRPRFTGQTSHVQAVGPFLTRRVDVEGLGEIGIEPSRSVRRSYPWATCCSYSEYDDSIDRRVDRHHRAAHHALTTLPKAGMSVDLFTAEATSALAAPCFGANEGAASNKEVLKR